MSRGYRVMGGLWLLPTHKTTQTSPPQVEFEQAKMVHALAHASTVIGTVLLLPYVKFVTDNDIHCKIC